MYMLRIKLSHIIVAFTYWGKYNIYCCITQIYQYALRLIETYFSEEEVDEDKGLAHSQQTDQFQFSNAQPSTSGLQNGGSGFNF